MIQHFHYAFFVFYDILFLVLANKSLQHHLHCIELTVSQTSHQVDLTEASNGEAFAYFVSL